MMRNRNTTLGLNKMRTKKKNIFIQDCGIFQNEILIITGSTEEEMIDFIKKEKINKTAIVWIKENVNFEDIRNGTNVGGLYYCESSGFMVMVTGEYEDTWDYWETILHEVVHVVQNIRKVKGINGEDESEAYLTEYLFRNIRRKLQGVIKQ